MVRNFGVLWTIINFHLSSEAGNCFVLSAEMQLGKGESKHEAASNYVDASTCYKKTHPQKAVDCLLKAVDIYTDMVKF